MLNLVNSYINTVESGGIRPFYYFLKCLLFPFLNDNYYFIIES